MTEARDSDRSHGINRRTVVKGAAWAVPVIAVGSAVPSYAVTGEPPTVLVGTACKLPGASQSRCPPEIAVGILAGDFSKAFALPVQVVNNTDLPIVLKPSITITNVRDGNGNSTLPFDVQGIFPDYCTPINPGESVNILIYANSDNSANDDVYADLTLPWGARLRRHRSPADLHPRPLRASVPAVLHQHPVSDRLANLHPAVLPELAGRGPGRSVRQPAVLRCRCLQHSAHRHTAESGDEVRLGACGERRGRGIDVSMVLRSLRG